MIKNLSYSFVLIVMLCATNVLAQTIAITTDSVSVSGSSSEFELVGNNYVENLTGGDLTIVWKRTVNNLPNGWTSSVCDKMACWAATTDSKSFALQGNRTEKLDVHFYPNNNIGAAIVEMLAWVQGDSANTVVKSTFKANAGLTSNITTSTKKKIEVSFYPNPVKDNMFVAGLPENQSFKVELYSLLGTKVITYNLPAGTSQSGIHQIDMQELPKGVYMVRIVDKSMNLIFNKSVSKMK